MKCSNIELGTAMGGHHLDEAAFKIKQDRDLYRIPYIKDIFCIYKSEKADSGRFC